MSAAAGLSRDDLERMWPGLYERFCAVVEEARSLGVTRWSSDAAAHRVRWGLLGEGRSATVVNDHATAAFARVWLAEHPEAPTRFFELRQSQYDPPGHDPRQPGLFDGKDAS